jgi:hypothetical protein
MSPPWIKNICLFVHQTMGCSMTFESCSRYSELCPPSFGYPSKHMERLRCLLLRRLMINAILPESHHFVMLLSKGILSPILSQPLCNLSLALIPGYPECLIKSLFEINEAFSLIIKSMMDKPSNTSG